MTVLLAAPPATNPRMRTSSTRVGRLFVISSPSGGGKTTVVRALVARMPGLVRSISVTTRPRRPNEQPGRDYQFIATEKFEHLRDAGELLESARVHGASYGTRRAPVERALSRGKDCILSLDVQGARTLKRLFGRRAVLVFLVPPSLEHLRERLERRQTDTRTAIRARLEAARHELACLPEYDYAVINHRLPDAIEQLKAIITAERLRVRAAELPEG